MVATLEKLLNMCPIDNQLLQTYYNKLPENCKSYFANDYIYKLPRYGELETKKFQKHRP